MQRAASPPAARAGVGPAPAAGHRQGPLVQAFPLYRWVPYAVFILTSAIVSAWLVRAYKVDRTMMLGIQSFAWAIAAYLLLASLPRHHPNAPRVSSAMSRFLALFLFAIGLSTVAVWLLGMRTDIGLVGLEVGALIYAALPFFLLARAARALPIGRAILWTCHVVLALSCYSILSDFLGFTRYEAAAGRYFGGLGDPVAWALTLPLIVYFSTQRFALAAVAAAALVLTASRAPTLTVIASILLLIGFGRGRRFHYIAMLVVLLTIGLYQAGLFTTLLTRFSATELLANDRTATAAQGIKIFLTSPVVGRGYNALTYLYPSTGHRMALGILPAQTSMFVEVLSDWGILAFVPYICFVIASTVVGIALMHRSKDLPEGSFINGVVAWLLAILWANQSAVWFLVGSYLAPLVFGMAGLVAGSRARLKAAQGVARPDLSPQLQSALRSPAVGQ